MFSQDRRRGQPDRRSTWRGGRRRSDFITAAGVAALCLLVQTSSSAEEPRGMKIGFDANSIARARELGLPVSYGSLWVGAWNQERYGWGGIRTQLDTARDAGVTPVIQWWYWGDDLSPECVERGCRDQYYDVWKDKATWDRMSSELADVVVRSLGPRSGAIIIVETEFNKASMQRNETFDGWLADKAAFFRSKGLRVVVGFGNWGRENWKNYDRAVAAADLIGVQALLSSVRDERIYLDGADMLISAAKHNQTAFGKPSFVTDFAFSSYPEPAYEGFQDTVIRDIFRRMGELQAAGVEGMVWRMLADDPKFDTANYHGQAERHWGLIRADGSRKRAFEPFKNGMVAESRRASSPADAAPPVASVSRRRPRVSGSTPRPSRSAEGS